MGPLRLLALTAVVTASGVATTHADCIDQELADKLAVKRKRRAHERDFVKAQRHELSLSGGYFVSDLFSASYVLGGAYTFHMTEETAVEASVAVAHPDAEVIRAVEDGRGQVIDDPRARSTFVSSSLVYYPLHGKLRFGGAIVHFDVHLDIGVGVVDSPTSRGAAAIGGIGFKFYTGRALAIRIDARDHIYRQELLDERFLVNDVSVTAGVAVFLPLGF